MILKGKRSSHHAATPASHSHHTGAMTTDDGVAKLVFYTTVSCVLSHAAVGCGAQDACVLHASIRSRLLAHTTHAPTAASRNYSKAGRLRTYDHAAGAPGRGLTGIAEAATPAYLAACAGRAAALAGDALCCSLSIWCLRCGPIAVDPPSIAGCPSTDSNQPREAPTGVFTRDQ